MCPWAGRRTVSRTPWAAVGTPGAQGCAAGAGQVDADGQAGCGGALVVCLASRPASSMTSRAIPIAPAMACPRSPWSPGTPLPSRILGFHRDHREATRRSRSKRPRPPVIRRSGTITLRASSAPGPGARTKEPSTWARLPAHLKACGRHAGRPPSWATSRTGRGGNHSPSSTPQAAADVVQPIADAPDAPALRRLRYLPGTRPAVH